MTEPGPGVDAAGNPVWDPTRNVFSLVEAAIRRQDDLREAESRHLREIAALRAEYTAELRKAETERINAVRAVDVQAVQRAAEVQATQASALAAQVVATADAFRVSLAATVEPLIRDIADLRKTQYEQAGQRAQVVETRDVRGSSTQNRGVWMGLAVAVLASVAGTFVGLVSIGVTIYLATR